MRKIVFIMNDFSLMGGTEKVTATLIDSFKNNNIPVWGIISLNQLNEISAIDYPENINIIVEKNIKKVIDIIEKNDIKTVILQIGNIYLNKKLSYMLKKSKVADIKVISIFHNTPYAWIEHFRVGGFFDFLKYFRAKLWLNNFNKNGMAKIIGNSNKVFFVSSEGMKEAQKLFPEYMSKIDYIYNITSKSDRIEIAEKENILIYAGRFARYKNVFRTVKVLSPLLSKYPEWKFLILGGGEEETKIKKYLEKNNIKNIILIGPVKNVFDYLSVSKICILYSLFEGLPTILLEALYCKNVLVAYDGKGGFRDIVNDGKNGFMVKNDDELYKIIDKLLSDKMFYNSLYSNIIVSQDFDEEAILKKWQTILYN